MSYSELKTVLEKISKNKDLIENFRREVKNKTVELLLKQGYKKSEEEFAQDASEIIENLNIDEKVLKLVSGGTNEKLDKFKKAGIVALAGLSLGTSVSPELYAGTVIPNQSVKQKQEIQNKKSNWIDFPQLVTCLLIGGAIFGAGEHFVVKPLVNKFRKKDPTNSNPGGNGQLNSEQKTVYENRTKELKKTVQEYEKHKKQQGLSKFKTEEDIINVIFDHLKIYGDFKPINDYLDVLKNFGLELCKYREKFAEKDKITIQELLGDGDIKRLLDTVLNAVVALNNKFGEIGLDMDDATTYNQLVAQLQKEETFYIDSNFKVLQILEGVTHRIYFDFGYKISEIHNIIRSIMSYGLGSLMNNHINCYNLVSIKSDFDVIFNDIAQYLDNNLNEFLADENTKNVRDELYKLLNKYFEDTYNNGEYTNIKDLKEALQKGKATDNEGEKENKTTLREYLLEKIDYGQIKIKKPYEDIKEEIVENLILSRIKKEEAEE